MIVVPLVASIAYYLLLLYLLLLFARVILDFVRSFRRGWRPTGFGLVAAEIAYAVTDPPVKFFRRLVPPLSMGPVALDFGTSLTMVSVFVLMYVTTIFG